jgi:hypothetical protein
MRRVVVADDPAAPVGTVRGVGDDADVVELDAVRLHDALAT